MTKRTHKDTTRLTAKERAAMCLFGHWWALSMWQMEARIEKALQLHARETLERFKRRRGL